MIILVNMEDVAKFSRENNIELLVLFGSCALEKTYAASDVDVAVKPKRGGEVSKLDLIYKLDDLFDGKNIDLVVLTQDTDPLLLYEIFSKGKLLYEKYSGSFEKEKLRAWKLYIDTEKLRKMQDKYLKDFVKRMENVA